MSPADRRQTWRLLAFVILAGLAVAAWVHRPAATADARFGWRPDPDGVRSFLDELGPRRFFAQVGAEAMRKAAAEQMDTFLYRAMDKAHRARYGGPFVVGRQGIGDCVSWGAMHAVYAAECVAWELGELAEPPLLPATEAIYGGSRVEARGKPGDGLQAYGGWSDGSTGYAASRWLRDWGVVYREQLGAIDLTNYSADRAKAWGAYGCGGQGDGGKMDAVAKKHPCRHVVQVRNWDELVGSILNGHPVTIASSVGFNSGPRDADGFCRASGTWMHQMSVIGIRFAKNATGPMGRDGALICNSWGNYVGGGKFPADQPDGTFWASRADIERILGQGDSWAIGNVAGFPARELNHADWMAPAPVETLSRSDP